MIIDLKEPLEVAKEKELFEKLNKQGVLDARTSLIEHNLGLVLYVCNRFKSLRIEFDDMFSIGSIGLIKAVDNFDISKNVSFSTFAVRCIENEILLYLRKVRKNAYYEVVSTDAYIENPNDEDDEENSSIVDTLIKQDLQLEKVEMIETLKKALKSLTDSERDIVKYLFQKELSQEKVAEILSISQSLVSKKKKKISQKLKLLLNAV